MQRKRRILYKTKDKLIYNLHSIPKLLLITKLKNNKVKSNVLYSIPSDCTNTPNSNPTHGVWWRSLNRIPRYARAVIQTRASHIVMTPLSRISSWATVSVLVLLFGLFSITNLFWYGSSNGSVYAIVETKGDSTASMTLDTSKVEVDVAPGSIGYASKDITIKAANTESYTLSISSPGLIGPTTIVGAGEDNTITNMPNNSWGYNYSGTIATSIDNDTNNSNNINLEEATYSSITSDAIVLESGTNTSASPSGIKKTLSFAAKFSNDAVPGKYSAEVTLSLAATPKYTTYMLTYDANGGSGAPTGQKATLEGTINSYTFTINNTVKPTRTNYTFLGWANTSNAAGINYRAGDNITVSQSNTTLYAVWQQNIAWNNLQYMQDMTPYGCSTAPSKTPKTLIDKRDNSSYTVAKLDDGRCWMTSNLKLSGGRTLSSADSDVVSNWNFPTSLNDSNLGNDTGDICLKNFSHGDGPTDSSCYQKVQSYIKNDVGYYSWRAAVAGAARGNNTTSSPFSICPRGWNIPSGNRSNPNTTDFWRLFRTMNLTISNDNLTTDMNPTVLSMNDLTIVRSSPYNFVHTGSVINGVYTGPDNSTSAGVWWSSMAPGGYSAFNLYMYSTSLYPGTYHSARSDGYAIRCIAQ